MKIDFNFMMNFVDSYFDGTNKSFDNNIVAEDFSRYLKNFSDDEFCNMLIYTGYIPDLYESDSSQETIYSKLVEIMVCEWANRMGFVGQILKTKASYQDVNILIDNKIIVCDAKSFRLGRSQAAPNVKDFLKLADIEKWLNRYEKDDRIGRTSNLPK